MGIIQNLKSLFIEETGSEDAATSREQPVEAASEDSPDSPVHAPARPVDASIGKVDQRLLETLLNALEQNNLEGFDYLEFRQALRNLSKMNMDEATRYKSAYAMAQTMNVTPVDLTRTAKVYLDILAREKKAFSDALANQEKTQIDSRKERLAQLDKNIVEHQKQIESLMASINSQRQEMDKLKGELDEVHSKIVNTGERFALTHGFLTDEIQMDINKMEQYLK